ncbi:MAG: ABC transporter ATP-binding protein [Deltaproteobacteria bacterium]|nr:ABC transporter ATP-binding protein [Deltaproteobacteria bacterium]
MTHNTQETGLVVRLSQAEPIPLAAELQCGAGELLALVGPSGSGKTTILRALAGLTRIKQGKISCAGEIWFDSTVCLSPQQRRVGYVFQDYALFPHLNAQDNVALAVPSPGKAEQRFIADAWLERVHLAGFGKRYPAELSGGQRQRVALARALAREPVLLLLDEPFSAVDRTTRERLYEELSLLRRDLDMPIILVTHDLGEAQMLADRITVLHHGMTLQSDTPDRLVRQPINERVARVIGHRNIFTATVTAHEPENGYTVLSWFGQEIRAGLCLEFSVGSLVRWLIPKGYILLEYQVRPAGFERENQVSGVLAGCLTLGDTVQARFLPDHAPEVPIYLEVSAHDARHAGVAEGIRISISMHARDIHLMLPSPHF